MTGRPFSPAFWAYAFGVRAAGPLAPFVLDARVRAGKEDPARLGERRGVASQARPAGPLLWTHAASVGESLAVLPLIEALRGETPSLAVLLTTQTRTAADLLKARGAGGLIHQYAPHDHPACAARFLDHWRPEAALFTESELWPNLLDALARRAVPAALVNARISAKTARGWARAPRMAARMLSAFSEVLCADEASARAFRTLGAPRAASIGNLKWAAAPLAVDGAAFNDLAAMIGERPVWTAASTHAGEEAMIAQAHIQAAASRPGLLTLLAPRHPDRAEEVRATIEAAGLVVAQRSLGEPITAEIDVHLADTIGELGLLYALGAVAFVGGSLVAKGGQNPLEPARLERPVLAGPHTENFAEIYARLFEAGGAKRVMDGAHLGATLAALFEDAEARLAMARAADRVADESADVLGATLERLRPLLPWTRA